ncbi:hypothetical protein KSP39_PZI001983 [Platanthera zijinensis]|uniref:Uncharacterized protein n=1 Tax=Platanthera zijinensis TaxID=2320716 RepID=A0AAP0GEG8_9ASPA
MTGVSGTLNKSGINIKQDKKKSFNIEEVLRLGSYLLMLKSQSKYFPKPFHYFERQKIKAEESKKKALKGKNPAEDAEPSVQAKFKSDKGIVIKEPSQFKNLKKNFLSTSVDTCEETVSTLTETVSTLRQAVSTHWQNVSTLMKNLCRHPEFVGSRSWELSQRNHLGAFNQCFNIIYHLPSGKLFNRMRPALIELPQSAPAPVAMDVKKLFRTGNPPYGVGVVEGYLFTTNIIAFSSVIELWNPYRMILNEWYLYAFCGLAVSGATDWLDGFVARKMNINSVMGSYLDPLADKILIVCVAVAMVKMDLLNPGLVGIIVLRDVALVGGAVFTRASSLGWEWKSWSDLVNLDDAHSEKVEPLLISKINTVFQLLLVAAALLQPELGTEKMKSYVTYLRDINPKSELVWWIAGPTTTSQISYSDQQMGR